MATIPLPQSGSAKTVETIEQRFRRLAAVWHRETDFLSSMSAADSHPAYQEIIQLGPEVVPLLLRDLEATHSHWFGALHALTGANPAPSAQGNIPQMVEAWLRWGKDNGHEW